MNQLRNLVVLFLAACVQPATFAFTQVRSWTASPTRQVQAEYLGLKDGVVSLRTTDGKVHQVRLDRLVADDQKFVMDTSGWGRVWTRTSGEHFIADLVRADAKTATMTGTDGKELAIPLDGLSGFDRQYIIARSATGDAPDRRQVTGKVVGVTDGDTVTLLVGNRPLKVRLEGIDAPEQGQAFGSRAKQFLSEACFGKEVILRANGRDRYGRTIGTILVGSRDVNASLVEAGLAWHYVEYSSDENLARLEKAAREAKVGLWSEPNPVPPWDWRRWGSGAQRKWVNEHATGTGVPIQSQQIAPVPAPLAPVAEATELTHWLNTKGNVRHNEHCRWYKNTKAGRMCGASEGKACGQCGG